MPSGPGVISDDEIDQIAGWIGTRAARVLLTSRHTAEGIGEQFAHVAPDVVQIVDAITIDELTALRESHPAVGIMPVIHVGGEESVQDAKQMSRNADAVLLDSGNPSAAVKELGGTGRTHNWNVSRAICEGVDVPVFLAGGLNPANVAEAIRTARPFGVDVCSGVRRHGVLDADTLSAFMVRVRENS